MRRRQILQRLGYTVPKEAQLRLILDTDAKNEADDQYAILHHLLTPLFDVRGIIAAHFESKAVTPGETMEKSYREVEKLLALAQIDDVPYFRGCQFPLGTQTDTPDSEGVRFLIEEARREDDRPLYIAVMGAATNVAAALNRAPDIADKLVVIWNGGGAYPHGSREFNLNQDADACRALLASKAAVWQIPQNVYSTLEVSLAELAARVRPCGPLGEYLFAQLLEENERSFPPVVPFRTGENWMLGDNTTVSVLMNNRMIRWHEQTAPCILPDLRYADDPQGKKIRVYDSVDVRMTMEDLFAKLSLAYGRSEKK